MRDRIRAIIADDETHCIETLEWQLQQYCPEVEIVRTFRQSQECQSFLRNESVDLAFLDVEMPMLNGLDLLKSIKDTEVKVIFTTAYGEFDLGEAPRVVGVLLKPIDHIELQSLLATIDSE